MIGTMNEAWRWPFVGHRLGQELANKISGHATVHGVADNCTGIQILVTGEIQPTLICRDRRNIGQLDLIRSICHKFMIRQVAYRQRLFGKVRCSFF